MGYEYYIVNETKKQIFGGFKRVGEGYEGGDVILAYLSICNGDTFRFVGESDVLIESTVFMAHDIANRNHEWKVIDAWPSKSYEQLYQEVNEG